MRKDWWIKEELTCWWVKDLLVAIWEQQGGRYLLGPMFSCHSDLIRGPDQEEDQLSLSPLFWCAPSELTHTHSHRTSEELRLVFVHNENWCLCWRATWQALHRRKKKKKSKIKQDSYSSLRTCGAVVVQFSSLEPEAWQKRVSPLSWHRTSCS